MPPRRSYHSFVWRNVISNVAVTENHRIDGWTMLNIRVVEPVGAPLPFAIDGTLKHGIEHERLNEAGGVLAFLSAWAEREARYPGYLAAAARWRQGDPPAGSQAPTDRQHPSARKRREERGVVQRGKLSEVPSGFPSPRKHST